jgi:hypothetical protein
MASAYIVMLNYERPLSPPDVPRCTAARQLKDGSRIRALHLEISCPWQGPSAPQNRWDTLYDCVHSGLVDAIPYFASPKNVSKIYTANTGLCVLVHYK